MGATAQPRLPVAADRPGAVRAGVGRLDGFDGRPVAWFRGAVAAGDARTVARVVHTAVEYGVPVVGMVDRMGFDVEAGLSALDGVGAIARELTAASGVVPTALVLDGPCLGGSAILVGLVDLVVMTTPATLFVNSPESSASTTGTGDLDPGRLGGAWTHESGSGVATLLAEDLTDALSTVGEVLSFLPANNLEVGPSSPETDPADRDCCQAAAAVPSDGRSSYDVRSVIGDILDDHHFVELGARWGKSMVVGLGRVAGRPVGVVANQPSQLAGALDIDSSIKGARFVRWCDAFNTPLVTLVDTPGFRPGRDQEWLGIVRHGAKLAFAYAEATVPRVSVVLRKAFGGAYIVMDSKAMGNDCALAWPDAEIAVMGPGGAVEILHRKRLLAASDGERHAERVRLEAAYAEEHLSPRAASDRGFVDAVIEPASTRLAVAEAVVALASKRASAPRRGHENIPL